MRILAIRGSNLASLDGAFAIDLAEGPLATAGLFAITGETGAGKSTILDALCLALYGTFPRAAVRTARGETAPDPSGDTLTAGNPAGILRRGRGRGHAEVDFIGVDGHGYRARFEVNRSRDRPSGKLQAERRLIERLDGSGAVASGIRETDARIAELTGFTFDQFRRTVLLAQGDFDAFLMASEDERAGLLERVTGTEIYGRISSVVHRETAARRIALDADQRAADLVAVLDEGARAALVAEQHASTDARDEARRALQAVQDRLRRAGALAEARAALERAQHQVADAETAIAASAPDRTLLAGLEAVAPLRSLARDLARHAEEHARAQTNHATAQIAGETAIAMAARAVAEESRAATDAAAAAAEVERHEPVWQKAALLDEALAKARAEHDEAQQAAESARSDLARLEADKARLDQSRTDLERRLAEADRGLEDRRAHAVLAEAGDRMKTQIDERSRTAAARRDAAARAAAAAERRQSDARRRVDAETRLAAAVTERDRLDQRLRELRSVRDGLDEQATIQASQTLTLAADALAKARTAAADRDAAVDAQATAGAIRATAATDAVAARADLDAAILAIREADAAIDAARAVAFLAEATLTEQAGKLRAHLLPDQPCPVCGAREHPYDAHSEAATVYAAALRSETARFEARRAAAEDARHRAAEKLATSRARAAGAEAEGHRAVEAAAAATARLASSVEDFERARPALAAIGITLDRAALSTRDAIEDMRRRVGAHQLEVARRWEALRTLAREIDGAEKLSATAIQTMDVERNAVEDARRGEHDAQSEAERQAGLAEVHAEHLARLDAGLAPLLTAGGLGTADLDRDPRSVSTQLAKLARAYAALVAIHAEAARELAELQPALASLAGRRDSAMRHRDETAGHLARRSVDVDRLASERAALLGGETVQLHRERLRNAASAAREKLELARSERERAETGRAAAAASEQAAAHTRAAAAAQLEACQQHWQAELEAAGIPEPEARARLAVTPEAIEAITARLAALVRARDMAIEVRSSRQADIDTILAADPTLADADRAALAHDLQALSDQLAGLERRLGEIGFALAADDAARARRADAAARIEAARSELAVWKDLDVAIGHSDGRTFRRFAQGLTLGHLVQLANASLAMLNPRYELRHSATGDLALEVIDRDMGGEARTPRSLSGGERFLVSLALALGLAGLEGRRTFVDTLFVDEGFGSLDGETLETAISALEALQSQGRKVGVVTHVASMIERIPVQVRVERQGGGRSTITILAPGQPRRHAGAAA